MPLLDADIVWKASQEQALVLAQAKHHGQTLSFQLQLQPKLRGDPQEGFWAILAGTRRPPIADFIKSATPIQMSFQIDGAVVFFQTAILKSRHLPWQPYFVLLKEPDSLSIVQRRQHPRESVPDEVEVHATVATTRSASDKHAQFPAEISDLSRSGISLICPPDAPAKQIQVGQSIFLIIHYAGKSLPMTAHCRRLSTLDDGSVHLGAEFVALDEQRDPQTFYGFERLISDLHRLHLRRHFRVELRGRNSYA